MPHRAHGDGELLARGLNELAVPDRHGLGNGYLLLLYRPNKTIALHLHAPNLIIFDFPQQDKFGQYCIL